MSKLILVVNFVLAFLLASSQSVNLSGKVLDENKSPVDAATVFLLNTDSTFIQGTAVNEKGFFIFYNIGFDKKYLVKIISIGYNPAFKSVFVPQSSVDMGTISLSLNTAVLRQVVVEGKIPLAIQNGDTTSYKASAYKVNKDATTEDLVTKMPGVTIVDGKVQAQGEEVKQVLVDGKVFFGDDASAVLKNIPAEVVDKIQVFDKKSDQAQFTGFDDGNTTKTINIVTKPQFRNGTFGKVYGGYGYENKYHMGGTLNIFKGNRRITLLAQSNNVNEQNFSSEDLVGVLSSAGGGGAGGAGRGRGGNRGGGAQGGTGAQNSNNADNFLINAQNGINIPTSVGFNYSDKWGKKTDVSGSYFYNNTRNNSETNLLQQYIVGSNNGLIYSESNHSNSTNQNNRFNLKIETKPDTQNSFIFQPKFSFQRNDGSREVAGQNSRSGTDISKTSNHSTSALFGYSISTPILYRHAFAQRGRTFSIQLNPTFTKNTSENSLYTQNIYYNDTSFSGDTIDQHASNYKTGNGINGNIVYTEPISKAKFLSFNYSGSFSQNYSSKETFNKDYASENYSTIDTQLTSIFKNQYKTQSGGIGFRYQKDKLNFGLNAAYQWAQLNKQQENPSVYHVGKTFQSILLSAQLHYKISDQKTLRINYRSTNNAPGIDQLQEVINNSNSLQLSTGNPDLKQDFQQSLNIRYTKINTKKANSFFALLSGNYSMNYIGNSTLIASKDTIVYNDVLLARGSQIQRPVNLNGYYSLRSFVNYTFPIKKVKTNLSVNASLTYNRIPGLINHISNFASTTSGGLGLVFSSNVSEKVDFTLSSNSAYSSINNTLQTSSNNNYFTQYSKFKITLTPVKYIVLQSEYTNSLYAGLSSSYNQSISLWNAGIGYKFLKNEQGEFRLSVYDLLNQNNSIQRTNTDSYTQDLQTNVLKRYYMLTFTYNFKKYTATRGKR